MRSAVPLLAVMGSLAAVAVCAPAAAFAQTPEPSTFDQAAGSAVIGP